MSEQFVLSLLYNGEQKEFVVNFIRLPYTYQLQIFIGEQSIFFEPDEEGMYRVITMPWQDEKDIRKIDAQLLQKIGTLLNTIR